VLTLPRSTWFAAGSFYTKKLCSSFIRLKLNFIKKTKIAFEPPFGGLRGNVRTPSIAHWETRCRLPIGHNWTFYVISYGWDVISWNLSKSAFFEGVGGSLWAQISDRREHRPPTTVGFRNLEWLLVCVVSKYPQFIVWFCHEARVCRTDRRIDRITTANTAQA